jgi:glyoxylase-like metal-dependent hydrolase (beta-lactamase superfamily II)
MIFGDTGQVVKDLYVLGLALTPSYLMNGFRPVLFEAGFCCLGRLYVEDIRKVLGDRPPETLFLTHVHYDHCGAAAYFKKVFPGIKVAASSRSAEIIKRPNARKLMKDLSANIIPHVAAINGINPNKLLYESFEPFEIDVLLEDGQVIQLTDDVSVEVISTAGHTRDQLSYYIPERKILFATESVGDLDRIGQIIPEFLVDFELYLTNIKRLALLDVEILCLGHQFVVLNSDVKEFFPRSVKETELFKSRVEKLLIEENGDINRVVTLIKTIEYDINPGPKQLEQAYLINLTTRVTHLAKKLGIILKNGV